MHKPGNTAKLDMAVSHDTQGETLFADDPNWEQVRARLRHAVPSDAERVARWISMKPWRIGFEFYLVGSLLEKDTSLDLDIAICSQGKVPSTSNALAAMTDIRQFGLYDSSIRIDPVVYPMSQDEVLLRAHSGRVFEAWRVCSRYWVQRCAAGDAGLSLEGGLVRIRRRLSETNYYLKLPLSRGAEGGRTLRPGRRLV